ncbi:MAG: hypothetical protein EB027_03335 [Actinobacteria bacterium]|nr:hypothetical protein [Actinomycetota bacterium]
MCHSARMTQSPESALEASSTPADRWRLLVVNNTRSARARHGDQRDVVLETLASRGCELTMITADSAAGVTEALRTAMANPHDGVVSIGGDGTLHLCLQALAGTSTPLAIVPMGTGNDVAHYLGLVKGEPRATAEAIIASLENPSKRVQIDVARVRNGEGTSRWFLTILACGFDTVVNERANLMKFPKGNSRYLASVLRELPGLEPYDYEVTLDGQHSPKPGLLMAVGLITRYGGGFHMCPHADAQDGMLSWTHVAPIGRARVLALLGRVLKGTHLGHSAVSHGHARTVHITVPGLTAYADGEVMGTSPLEVECVPRALTLLIGAPPTAA